MKRWGSTWGWTLFAALCLLANPGAVRPAGAEPGGTPGVVEGRVNALNVAAGAIRVADTDLTVSNSTTIRLNDQPASLNDLAVGDTARASFDPASHVASEVLARRPLAELWGTITAYNPATGTADATFTFRLRDNTSFILYLNATTHLPPLEDGDDLSSFVGKTALAHYDPVTRVAKDVRTDVPAPPEPDPGPTPAPTPEPQPQPREGSGVVTSVSAADHTVTVLLDRHCWARLKIKAARGAKEQSLVLSCDDTTQITLSDQPATLADLARGDRARFAFVPSSGNNLALRIRAALPPIRAAGGIVQALDPVAQTVTLVHGKHSLTLTCTGATRISVDGQEADFGGLKLDQRAAALFVVRNDTPMALAVVTMSPPVHGASRKRR